MGLDSPGQEKQVYQRARVTDGYRPTYRIKWAKETGIVVQCCNLIKCLYLGRFAANNDLFKQYPKFISISLLVQFLLHFLAHSSLYSRIG